MFYLNGFYYLHATCATSCTAVLYSTVVIWSVRSWWDCYQNIHPLTYIPMIIIMKMMARHFITSVTDWSSVQLPSHLAVIKRDWILSDELMRGVLHYYPPTFRYRCAFTWSSFYVAPSLMCHSSVKIKTCDMCTMNIVN